MALLNPYCTVGQLRQEVRKTQTTELTDTECETAIHAASRWIEWWKGRDYIKHDHSSSALIILKAHGHIRGAELFLPYRPIITLTTVTVATEEWEEGVDFVALPEGSLVTVGGNDWPQGNTEDDRTEIVGVFGYAQSAATAVPSLPEHISRAAVLIAAALTGKDQKDVTTLDGTRTAILERGIHPVVMKLLGGRRLLV